MGRLRLKYFVLEPYGVDASARASQLAIRAYATYIHKFDPDFADDLFAWVNRLEHEANLFLSSAETGKKSTHNVDEEQP